MRVLIIDQVKIYREAIKYYLEEFALEALDEAETGIEAITKIKNLSKGCSYDIIIVDVDFPKKSGLHILKDITMLSPDSKIVVCTAINDTRTVKTAKDFGVNGYIVKPFARDRFMAIIQKLILTTQ
ncbi:MAG: response regulator receiver protein [Pelosinus sp.]|jgi:DNA-binding NarL/FixJ family response regulator|nr:response regulator receiver protein [Pelosinus sp.]